jgi:S-adenosylmethionine:tRNA ribosyltransferase-isomerase
MLTRDFDFDLPEALVAQHPLPERGASRLLHVHGPTLADRAFADLPGLLALGDLLVMNDTRVIKARLLGAKQSGGQAEVLVERIVGEREALALVRVNHGVKPGLRIEFEGGAWARVLGREDTFARLEFSEPVDALLERLGRVPLPPYIAHAADAHDESRYQTVYARAPGAVAAPTAGLHFDAAMLDALRVRGIGIAHVTLHVGAGTFQPVRVEDLSEHCMHAERYEIPQATVDAIDAARANGGRIIAVGTTSLRALESAADESGALRAGAGETRLFITPGYRFRVVDRLVTNFHLPRSTLFMLVCAFGGMQALRAAYAHAIRERYRFFSYGDAMLIEAPALSPDRPPRLRLSPRGGGERT